MAVDCLPPVWMRGSLTLYGLNSSQITSFWLHSNAAYYLRPSLLRRLAMQYLPVDNREDDGTCQRRDPTSRITNEVKRAKILGCFKPPPPPILRLYAYVHYLNKQNTEPFCFGYPPPILHPPIPAFPHGSSRVIYPPLLLYCVCMYVGTLLISALAG
ncbi:hypothetical protein F4825DRAFT_105376 [Nemania diffusa]|nr:hypothetical protein F4825DRAFT_105376 [Nemania diffusa]